MVGLGDRHVQNILIDTNTAEFIHIDLGKCDGGNTAMAGCHNNSCMATTVNYRLVAEDLS